MKLMSGNLGGFRCAPGAGRLGLNDCIGALASPKRLLTFPGIGLLK
jgi:hypothetical protein